MENHGDISGEILATSKIHKRLMNKAVHYLGRYQSSQQRLRKILRQFAKRKFDPEKTVIERTPEEIEQAISDVIALCVHYGYVDDTALAQAKARSSVVAGLSAYQLSGKLRHMGVDETTTNDALSLRKQDYHDAEKAAAIRAMRKKRLGPFHSPSSDHFSRLDFAEQQKQISKLALLGFGMSLCKSILSYQTISEAEEALYDAEAAPSSDEIGTS